jgi:hypothetical protein
MAELEQKLQALSEESRGIESASGEAEIEVLKEWERSVHQICQTVEVKFDDALWDWARKHSGEWKKVRDVLIEDGATAVSTNEDLNEFSTYVKQGLIPLWTKDVGTKNEYFFDFTTDTFCRLKDDGDKQEMQGIHLGYRRREVLIGGKVELGNLVPKNYLKRMRESNTP